MYNYQYVQLPILLLTSSAYNTLIANSTLPFTHYDFCTVTYTICDNPVRVNVHDNSLSSMHINLNLQPQYYRIGDLQSITVINLFYNHNNPDQTRLYGLYKYFINLTYYSSRIANQYAPENELFNIILHNNNNHNQLRQL